MIVYWNSEGTHNLNLCIFSVFPYDAAAVKIVKLQVPKVIQHGSPVVLDCDFSLEATDDVDAKDVGLVVKWYFNENDNKPVYQWIPGELNEKRKINFSCLGFIPCSNSGVVLVLLNFSQSVPFRYFQGGSKRLLSILGASNLNIKCGEVGFSM